MFFGYGSLLEASGGNMSADTGWTEERSFKCIDYICTTKRYLSQKRLSIWTKTNIYKQKRDSHSKRIITSCNEIKEINISSDCFTTQFGQASRKKDYIWFSSLKKKHTCIHIVKSNATNRAPDKKYWHWVNNLYRDLLTSCKCWPIQYSDGCGLILRV